MATEKKLTQKEKDQPLMVQFATWFYKACGRRHKIDQAAAVTKNATLLKNDEIFWTAFEPKTNHRHIVKVTNNKGKEVFPTFVMKKVERPSLAVTDSVNMVEMLDEEEGENQLNYYPLTITMYDPIVPSTPQAVYETLRNDLNCYTINIRVLGPVGDNVEEWEIKNAKITDVFFSPMDWSKTGDPATVRVVFKIDDVILKY